MDILAGQWSIRVGVGTAPELCRLLHDFTPWKHVEQIDLHLSGEGEQRMRGGDWVSVDDGCIATLAALPRLRKLVVHATPAKACVGKITVTEPVPLEIPGVASLRRHVQGLKELVVHGIPTGSEESLRAELLRPRKVLGPQPQFSEGDHQCGVRV